MIRSTLATGLMAVLCWFVSAGSARAQDEAVPVDRIPKAVMSALLGKFPKAAISKSSRTKEDGEVVYDLEFTDGRGKAEADITEKGRFVNYERAIAASALPKAVRDAVEKRYPKATVKEVMKETEVKGKSERTSAYEVVMVQAAGQDVEVRVSPAGKILEDTTGK